MTKGELVELVDRVWATWNVDISMNAKKASYEAWFRVLKDLDIEPCHEALDDLAVEDRPWQPRPGTLRKKVIDNGDPHGAVPTAFEAWTQYRSKVIAAASGAEAIPLHPLVRATVDKLGASSEHALHTNGDRDMFMKTYESMMNQAEENRYRIQR
jgi:hypothetical protein